MSDTVIFALESSCDETAAAIVKNGCVILANVVATQIDVHKDFGGVIPEVASRIHVENISMVIAEALKQADMTMEEMDAIAITQGPGLIGSLHVGVQAAKTLAYAFDKPLVPVHHIAGHIYANRLVEELHFLCWRWSFPAGIPNWSIWKMILLLKFWERRRMMQSEKLTTRWPE